MIHSNRRIIYEFYKCFFFLYPSVTLKGKEVTQKPQKSYLRHCSFGLAGGCPAKLAPLCCGV